MKRVFKTPPKLALAKENAIRLFPEFQIIIFGFSDVEFHGDPREVTMAVDAKLRLYHNPLFIEQRSIEDLTAIVLHEAHHVFLQHSRRGEMLGMEWSWRNGEKWRVDLFNKCLDCAIYDCLKEIPGIEIPKDHYHAGEFKLANNKSGEWYFHKLEEKFYEKARDRNRLGGNQFQEAPKDGKPRSVDERIMVGTPGGAPKPSPSGGNSEGETTSPGSGGNPGEASGGSPGQGTSQGSETSSPGQSGNADGGGGSADQNDMGGNESQAGGGGNADSNAESDLTGLGPKVEWGGSCGDGVARDYEIEEGSPEDKEVPGLGEYEQRMIIKKTAEIIMTRGSGVGDTVRGYCEEILKPVSNPRRDFLARVRKKVGSLHGYEEWSYKRPSRRTDWKTGIIRPSTRSPVPRMTIIVDTSGSMNSKDIGLAMGLLIKIFRTFRIDKTRVIVGGADIAAASYVRNPKNINFRGGGGTDMGKIIKKACRETPRPDLVICITDCITPWCHKESCNGVDVVIAATRDSKYHAQEARDHGLEVVEIYDRAK